MMKAQFFLLVTLMLETQEWEIDYRSKEMREFSDIAKEQEDVIRDGAGNRSRVEF